MTKNDKQIPKLIFYCWFGNKKMSNLNIKCIASWKKYFPDYKIIEINENNFNVNEIEYTFQAYKKKKYAFVSDYARFKFLYKYGGIYFDTDVEIIRSFNKILNNGPFMATELDNIKASDSHLAYNINKTVAPGLGLGCYPNSPLILQVLKNYETQNFNDTTKETIVDIVTKILYKNNMKNTNTIQKINDFTIYPKEFFNPKSLYTGKIHLTENTYSIHWYEASWMSNGKKIINKILMYSRRLIGLNLISRLGQNKLMNKIWKKI